MQDNKASKIFLIVAVALGLLATVLAFGYIESAGPDRRESMTERQAPRKQRLTGGNGPHREAMALEHGLRECARDVIEEYHRARVELPDRNRHVVTRDGQPAGGGKRERRGH